MRLAVAASLLAGAMVPLARAGDLVVSGFEPGQTWNGSSWVVSAAWPDSFQGSYALNVKDSNQSKRWPVSGNMSETLLSIRVHFRVKSDNLSLDPNHDGKPFEQLSLVGVLPRNTAGARPNVALKRDDNLLVLRIEDYSGFEFVHDAVVVPDRWHVLDYLLDQSTNQMAVALDGVTLFDDTDADIGSTAFTAVEFGIPFSNKNGHNLWFDNVRIKDSGGLQGPELIADATATPGVGPAPLTSSFTLNTTAGSPTIEWDFEGDGVFDATGYTASKSYSTGGTYKPVARVTNSSGRAAAYPPIIHATVANAPAVTVTKLGGGATTLAFPRIFDVSASVTPASGAKITKVEYDWSGGGDYSWHSRTTWSHSSAITVRMPHNYPFDTTTAVVRAKATDDSGRVGVGELALTLPTAPGNPTIAPRDTRAGIYITYGWPEIYLNRGNVLPAWITGVDVGTFISWEEIETADNVFNFGPVNGSNANTFNGRVSRIINGGKNAILHHQSPFPGWLFSKVGKSKKANNKGDHYPQFWDPRYHVYLKRFIDAGAANVQALLAANPSWSSSRFVLSRGQTLAIDSELLPRGGFPVYAYPNTPSSMALTSANFTAPPSGAYPVDFTPELATAYAMSLRTWYEDAFGSLGIPSVYKPIGGGWFNGIDSIRSDFEFRGSVANGQQGFFITNARADTGQDNMFLGYVDKGLARGFHELAGNANVPNATVQWQYWSLLSQLNCGSEFVGTYGDYAWFLEYQSEFESAPIHDFVNRHVGWKPRPAAAPYAFIALKPETAPPGELYSVGDYGALLTEMPDDGSDVADVGTIHYVYKGPSNLGHPSFLDEKMLWARSCPAGKRLHFNVNDTFRNAHANTWDLEIVFLDSYQGEFYVRVKNQRDQLKYYVVPMSGDGKWHRVVVPMKGVQLRSDLGPGLDFALEADAQTTTFHRLVLTPK